jgi:hypothetical protein
LYEQLDTQAELPAGIQKNPANARSTIVTGLMYKPHPGVAFKGEYRNNTNDAGTGVNQWNLAVNYMF